jgi:hypothetical protein
MKNTTKKTKYTTNTLANKLYLTSSYLRWSAYRIANQFGVTVNVANTAKKLAINENKKFGFTY